MKTLLLIGFIFLNKTLEYPQSSTIKDDPQGNNVFIITLDGLRWQEIFMGADSALINDPDYTSNIFINKAMFWHADVQQRRKKLMPFFWNVINQQGQLLGNRNLKSKVNTKNFYSISYPGYNEIFTGNTDITIFSNEKTNNRNANLLEYINTFSEYNGKVAVFSSWNVFPYILNRERSNIYINSGYELIEEHPSSYIHAALNKIQQQPKYEQENTRSDLLTYVTALEHIRIHQPKIVSLALGETDERAHDKDYDQYLLKANAADMMIGELWTFIQSIPFYRNKTTFIITTDHGRGKKSSTWYKHGTFVAGSSQTWLAMLGNKIKSLGEVKKHKQIYQKQIAGTVGYLLGIHSYNKDIMPLSLFDVTQPVASSNELEL